MVIPDAPPQLELRLSGEKVPQRRQDRRSAPSDAAQHTEADSLHCNAKQDIDHAVRNPSADRETSAPRIPPDGGRIAWTQVLASFLINMNVYGLVNAFGDFQHSYETQYLKQYSSSTISWIGTLQGSLTLFIGAVAGPIFDKGYFMLTLRVSSVLLVFSWMMLSLSTKYYQVSSYTRAVLLSSITLSFPRLLGLDFC